MRRWHQDYATTFREWKKHHHNHVEQNKEWVGAGQPINYDPWVIDCPCDTQVGRFRKIDAFDCGNTRCYVCHSDKYPKRHPTWQEIQSDLELVEELEDLGITPAIRPKHMHHRRYC